MIVLDGTSLTCADVAAIGRRQAAVEIGAAGRARASAAATTARALTARGAVYGRTTGVGANKGIQVGPGDAAGTGLRLVRSHASGAGPLIAPEVSLAALAVRANQIGAGGSGVDPGVLDVLAECVNRALRPPARRYDAIGTGDLAALAVTALCLLGERDWLEPESAGAITDRAAIGAAPAAGAPTVTPGAPTATAGRADRDRGRGAAQVCPGPGRHARVHVQQRGDAGRGGHCVS